jgi:hypothetical protein
MEQRILTEHVQPGPLVYSYALNRVVNTLSEDFGKSTARQFDDLIDIAPVSNDQGQQYMVFVTSWWDGTNKPQRQCDDPRKLEEEGNKIHRQLDQEFKAMGADNLPKEYTPIPYRYPDYLLGDQRQKSHKGRRFRIIRGGKPKA